MESNVRATLGDIKVNDVLMVIPTAATEKNREDVLSYSIEKAVSVVGKRIDQLISKKINTLCKIVLWKCGNNHVAAGLVGAGKWIRNVNLYYKRVYN